MQCRVARDFIPSTQARGYRSSPTYGILGCAATTAKLLHLDAAQTTSCQTDAVGVCTVTLEIPQAAFTEGRLVEWRAAAAGIPPSVVGFSEGLQGSALNAGNYESAKQHFAEMTMHPLWRNAAGSFASPMANARSTPRGRAGFTTRARGAAREGERVARQHVGAR